MDVTNRYHLTEPINATGDVSALGSARVGKDVIEAMADILPRTVDMVQLQERASDVIQRVVGTEAGCVSACAASAMVIGFAACMTGLDAARVEQLPDVTGLRHEIIVQRGHVAWFGASVRQMVRLCGARMVEIGDVKRAGAYQLAGAITDATACALYVVSHHTSDYEMIGLEAFCQVAHARDVPVVVDGAAESRFADFLACGADLICLSGHKFFGGPTAGILAGQRDLVRAALVHQHHGIGRPMKVGKEGIIGVMCALEHWADRDQEAWLEVNRAVTRRWLAELAGLPGLQAVGRAGMAGSLANWVEVSIDEQAAGLSASDIVAELATGVPPIIVRGDQAAERGIFQMEPTNVRDTEVERVSQAIRNLLSQPPSSKERVRESRPRALNRADALVQSLGGWGQDDEATSLECHAEQARRTVRRIGPCR